VDADFWDIGALAEGPISENWSLAISGRRSYIDWIMGGVLPDTEGFSFTVAPRYYDYQVVADYHPDSRDNLRLFAFGSDDKLVFVFGDDVGNNPNFGGGVDFAIYFHQFQAKWAHKITNIVSNEANAGVAYTYSGGSFGDEMRFDLNNVPIYFRDELIIDPKENFVLRTGVDLVGGWLEWEARFPDRIGMGGEGENFDPLSANEQYIERSEDLWYFLPNAYGEFEFTTIPNLRVISGLRLGYHPLMKKLAIDPRLAVRYQLFKRTTVKGGVGIFHQTPGDAESDEEFGNPDLDYVRALHYSVGVEQNLTDDIEVNLEGFYKDLNSLVVSSTEMIERDGEMQPERYNNDGNGQVYGLELMVKHHPVERFFGWISYTMMKSQRIDRPGEDARLFDYDQTHILTIVASAILGRGWEAGIRFRLVTGNPLTPVTDSLFDADSDIYWPIYGETNSDRLPTFHQLDVRIDKRREFKHLKFGVYIDVQNVYNQQNPEGYQYNYDFTERQYFTGVPIVPSLGLKLEY
jgi:hypothetical protein